MRGKLIESVQRSTGAPNDENDRVIEADRRVIMPGLIDAHWHSMFAAVTVATTMTADAGYLHLTAGVQAERTLLRGFTTVRDAGGPVFAPLPQVSGRREGIAINEAFRGDVLIWLRLDGGSRVARCHVRDPSWFQWPLLEAAIKDNIVADFPLCNKSFNCSYSGHDL